MHRLRNPFRAVSFPIAAASRRRAGFTFIEILATMIVLAIASAIVVPQICSHSDLTAASAARAVMGDILYAQNRAIALQTCQYVRFDVTDQTYGLYDSSLNVLTQPVSNGNYVMTFGGSGPSSVGDATLVSANFANEPDLVFDMLGEPYAYNAATKSLTPLTSSGSIVISSGDYSLTISVQPSTGELVVQ